MNFFFAIYLILPATLGPRVYSASNKNGYKKIFMGSRVLPVRKALDKCGILNDSQHCGSQPVTGIALHVCLPTYIYSILQVIIKIPAIAFMHKCTKS
jgi:hypothetical protein